MVSANELNSAIEVYLDKVDNLLLAYNMDSQRGTEVLDPVQGEVDATLARVRENSASSGITSVRLELNRSVERVESALCAISGQRLGGLGALPEAKSVHDSGPWSQVMSQVTGEIARLTDKFGALISNMPANQRNQIDSALAAVVDSGNTSMQRDDSAAAANAYLNSAKASLSSIEQSLVTMQNNSAKEMLLTALQSKDAERMSLLSQAESLGDSVTDAQKSVITKHDNEAKAILSEMSGNATTYDASVRDAKFRLIDKHLANIQKIVQAASFDSDLSGGMFTSQKNLMGIHRKMASNRTNFVPQRSYSQAAPPRSTRAGRIGNFGSAPVEKQGFFELSEPVEAKPYATRAMNTGLLVGGIAALGYLSMRGRR